MGFRLALLFAVASCAAGDPASTDTEPSDFDPVDWSGGKADSSDLPATFDRNTIISDQVLTASGAVTGDAVQAFLEHTPYGTRSWLADQTLDGMRFADAVVVVGQQTGVDPIVLLARAQVESSLISATAKPHTSRTNIALGCGCPDSGSCSAQYLGLGNQLRCAGALMIQLRDDSMAGTGIWNAHHAHVTSDDYRVIPANDATAAMYAYTPWVLPGHGGNWLVWNVTRKFLKAFDGAGTLNLP